MAKYIDAERLLNEARNLSGPMTGDGWDNLGVYALIERQPKADVRENVRGEWLLTLSDVYDFYKCSVCGHRIEAPGGVPHENFCPNCGASMQTEKKAERS